MITIHKYTLAEHSNEIVAPQMKQILTAQYDPNGFLCIWAIVDTQTTDRTRLIEVRGTGWTVPANAVYIDTVQKGLYVWHVFDLGEA